MTCSAKPFRKFPLEPFRDANQFRRAQRRHTRSARRLAEAASPDRGACARQSGRYRLRDGRPIAASANVQPSALVRFAQTFGFSGFSDLQAVFRQRLKARAGSYDERLKAIRTVAGDRSGDAALIDGFIASARQSLDRLADGIDASAFAAAADRPARAQTVFIIGRRRSYPVTSFLAYAFGKLGLRFVQAGSPSGIDEEILALAGPKDAAICVTFPPYAPQTVEQARVLAEAGVGVVAITDGPFSPLWTLASDRLAIAEAD
ncbi:MAG: SIS domain-containing protein, partial [Phyllobacteriaceae bacterium]|nr:SIS domain-containing protein [Phyllobacteriaceae bacterium]